MMCNRCGQVEGLKPLSRVTRWFHPAEPLGFSQHLVAGGCTQVYDVLRRRERFETSVFIA